MSRNIVLVGFMGTGKSSAGRMVAQRLGMQFVDMDEEIVRREGKSVPELFRERGEAAFRAIERALTVELSGKTGMVISTGGGIVLNPDNIRDLQRNGMVICLQAAPDEILTRIGHDANRPLLQGGEKLERISALLAERKPLYDAIPDQIMTAGHAPSDTAEAVIALYHKNLRFDR